MRKDHPPPTIDKPAIPHPTGPIKPRMVLPNAMPPPPAAIVPPPIHARTAFVAATPLNEEIAAPVLAVPKVVAKAVKILPPATAAPLPTPAAPNIYFHA